MKLRRLKLKLSERVRRRARPPKIPSALWPALWSAKLATAELLRSVSRPSLFAFFSKNRRRRIKRPLRTGKPDKTIEFRRWTPP